MRVWKARGWTRADSHPVLLAIATLALLTSADQAGAAEDRAILPDTVVPDHYRIVMQPDARALSFRASVDIDVTVRRPTSTIVLNAADLVIDDARLSGEAVRPEIRGDPLAQTARFDFGHPLRLGPHTLSITYDGKIYQQASGLFALDYGASGGGKRALFTQFENSDARRFVPSWDEPGRKATFQLTAVVPQGEMAISNMPATRDEPMPGGLRRVSFAPTPKMSSYLLFFGLGDFERVHRIIRGVDVGVVVKRGDAASAAFALDAASKILPYYDEYFGTAYPLPKLDLIAGPGSSQVFGAMENWGAIFYFERDLLIDPRLSTESDRQDVFTVVAHEMAHQWFGDLVTMAWWDDLWLNEGFASWMELKVTDHFHPEWKVWLQSLAQKQAVMQQDARDGTHPIITPITNVTQAAGAFDAITYLKGAAVIRMLEAYAGEAEFRDGVRRYMRDHAYANTVTDDLWREIDAGASRPITAIAHDFTLQAGVPMIVERGVGCAAGATELVLGQERYVIDPGAKAASVWRAPVIARALGQAAPARSVVSGGDPIRLRVPSCGPAVINAGQTAYFRSRYTPESLRVLTTRFGDLTSDDQLGLVNDTASLAYAGQAPMSNFLDLADGFRSVATDPVVAETLAGRLDGLDDTYLGLPGRPAFRLWAGGLLRSMLERVGWRKAAGESDNTAVLRARLLGALGDMDDPAVLAWARERFAAFLADPASLDPAARRTVLGIIAAHADPPTWSRLRDLARTARTELERRELYGDLAAATDETLVRRALDLSLTAEVPKTISTGMIERAADRHPALAFDFALAHWGQIAQRIEPAAQARYVPRLVANSFDLALIPKLDAFAVAHIAVGDRQDVRKAEAAIRYSAKLRAEALPQIDAWLRNHAA